ncbi:hypothetical protein ACJIZ3_007688 [Penstemon smallii]|uniref:Uncharacterized protein n=1 Tax=Penstemon smallii TaxID=265156 RepID=A0ABD3T7N4_9LAMI
MEEKAMGSTQEDDKNCNTNSNRSNIIQWSSETNWVIAHGSLENSINIESSDCSITESETDDRTRNPPLVLKPQGPDSCPCEIKICFTQKYDIGQIYVRSSARTFEVYYAKSPQSDNEYLCTVRCGIAERDEEILQTTLVEDVAKDHGESGDPTEEISTDGGSIVSSDDDWVKIKVPEVERSSLSNKTDNKKTTKIQDLYEATAQISDADPCSLLTIRLLSLQDKGHVYVDEIYIFVDPVESTDTGPEVPVSSSQSPLLAMLVPTLLQLSKPGASQVKDHQDSNEQHKDDKMETQLRRVGEVDVGLGKNQVDEQYVKSKDAAKSDEILQSDSALNSKKLGEFIDVNNFPHERIERALEQLINRVSRVEDICLRFEEKMLKPIENMEVRLQQVEQQLGKLTKNFNYSNLPHGTRISAPEFSCSGSNSSSFYNEGSDYILSEIEKKDLSCNKMPESSHYANIRPSLVVKAPEFSCSESNSNSFYNEGSDYIPSEIEKDLSCNKIPESSHYANIHPSLVVKAPEFSCSESNSSSFYNDGNDYIPSEIEKKDLSCNKMPESSDYANIHPSLVVKAPEFSCSVEEEYNDDLKESKDDSPCIKPKQTLSVDDALAAALSGFLSTARISLSENIQTTSSISVKVDEQNPRQEFAESCQIKAQELPDAENCSRGSSRYTQILAVTAPEFVEEIVEEEELLNFTEPHIETDCVSDSEDKDHADEELVKCTEPPTDTDCDSKHEDKDHGDEESVKNTEPSSDTSGFLKNEEKNHGKETVPPSLESKILSTSEESCDLNRNETTPSVSESLDFAFPILEVKFSSNSSTSTKSPIEALLDGETELNSEAPVHDSNGEDCDETKDLLPNHLLVDLGFPSVDGSVNLCTPSIQEMTLSLI